jgi:hypothetical protein
MHRLLSGSSTMQRYDAMAEYISLVDAWAQFWTIEAPPILQNRLLARPPAPSKKFVKDPKTERSYEVPQQGQEYAEGTTPYHVVKRLVSKFREVVVYPLENYTFLRSGSGKFTRAELSEWWPRINGLLAQKYTVILGDWAKDRNERVNIYDGGPLSWSAYRTGTDFPIDIWFDKKEFSALEVMIINDKTNYKCFSDQLVAHHRFRRAEAERSYRVYIGELKSKFDKSTETQDLLKFPELPRKFIRSLRAEIVPEWISKGRPKKSP